jgi:putative transcriptional regulator
MGLHRRNGLVIALILGLGIWGCLPASSSGEGPRERAVTPRKAPLGPGVFLVATRKLGDRNFARSVVLILDQGAGGSVGVVINRPTAVRLASVLPNRERMRKWQLPVHAGGPVERGRLTYLVGGESPPPEADRVLEGLHVSWDLASAEHALERDGSEERVRVYAGYAGWAPSQLENEIARGDWHVLTADAPSVFQSELDRLWERLVELAEAIWVRRPEGLRQTAMMPWRMAYWTSSAFECRSSSFMIWYLCDSTVRGEMLSTCATWHADCPSATRRSTST